jgi:polyhydroxyalkanoate synthase
MDTEKDSTVLGTLAKNIDAEKMVNSLGNVPSIYLQTCFSLLKPFKQGVNKYYNLIQNIDNKKFVENFLRIEKWLYDTPAIAGTIFKQWMNDIYKQNLLVHNHMELQGKRIDLSKIKVPLLNVIAEEDHLVSPEGSVSINSLVSSNDKRIMKFYTGHVGLIASNYSQNNVLPKVGQWIKSRSDLN